MILDILFFVIGLILNLFSALLNFVQFVIPDAWQTAIHTAVGYAGYLQGWLPIYPNTSATGLWHDVGIMTILGWAISLWIGLYLVEFIVMLIKFIPFFGHSVKLPHQKIDETK